jgi:hypothetical protein
VYFKVIKINQPPIIYMSARCRERERENEAGKDIRTKSVKGEAKNLYTQREEKELVAGVGLKKLKKAEHQVLFSFCICIYARTKGKGQEREKGCAHISTRSTAERSTGDEGALFMYSDVSQIETVS